MKIHLVKNEKEAIKGYRAVLYSAGKAINNLDTLSDNECEFILAQSLIDDFSVNQSGEVVLALLKKLRVNGTIVVGGTSLRVFCKSVFNGSINETDASEMIKDKLSMSNPETIISMLQGYGLKIQSSRIVGTHYEITAVRS